MKKIILLLCSILLLSAPITSNAFSLSTLLGSDKKEAATESNPIVGLLTEQLGISTEQAAGGAGALLALAGNSLSGSEQSELNSKIPGLESLTSSIPTGMSSMVGNMDSVNTVFSALGLDSSMVTKFAPLILKYLTSQDTSTGLIDSLGKLWG
ncbi:MAG: DUF2780 domain-containing protein [Aliivibrio sp.]|uniref:DUF2780 domain-containing protein n=1 Tax=Aliivibrio sp. TaxID=1872443 RepID=UPI001A4F2153|nr:DUF2780 domain-containing protein [Aliivibrio sp.]